jgi:hypothetical protein
LATTAVLAIFSVVELVGVTLAVDDLGSIKGELASSRALLQRDSSIGSGTRFAPVVPVPLASTLVLGDNRWALVLAARKGDGVVNISRASAISIRLVVCGGAHRVGCAFKTAGLSIEDLLTFFALVAISSSVFGTTFALS